jgi:hypothetical protein
MQSLDWENGGNLAKCRAGNFIGPPEWSYAIRKPKIGIADTGLARGQPCNRCEGR